MGQRSYQEKCNGNIFSRQEAGVRRQLVSMATGTGKTRTFSELPKHTRKKGMRTIVTVHTQDLVQQNADQLRESNPDMDVGIEMGDQYSNGEQIVVASIQTIGRLDSDRLQKFKREDFAWYISDEAHRSLSDIHQKVHNHFGIYEAVTGPTLVGFTATPKGAGGMAMGSVYEEVVFTYSIEDGIADGWLSDVRGIRVRTTTDISKIKTVDGDYDQKKLDKVVNTPERNAQIVDAWVRECYPRQTIGFTVSVQHAKDLALAFQKAGVPADAVWGDDPNRKLKMKQHREGFLKVLLCSQLLVEGYDDPNVSCVIMARPTRSSTFFIQAAGRGTRLGPGIVNLMQWIREGRLKPGDKRDMLLMDVCDASVHNSLVTLPTLFGLGPEVDLKGGSVMAAVKAVQEALAKNPTLDMSKLVDVGNLKAYIEEANLFKVTFCNEVTEVSKLQWHKRGENIYRLLLPNREDVTITGNLLGQFEVKGVIAGTKIFLDKIPDLPEALSFAEMNLALRGKEMMTLLRRDATWHKAPITEGQMKLLRKFKVPEKTIATMSKGDAHKWITRKFGEKR